MNKTRKKHWEEVYQTRKPDEVSWYQLDPSVSLDLIASTGITHEQEIIDVGAGASVLVDKLLDKGFQDITVLDISAKAIQCAKERLAQRAENVTWLEADITQFEPPQQYDLWHDRAVFHFLTDQIERRKYINVMKDSLHKGSHVIISAFSLEGPLKCSGLDVERYDSEKLWWELGSSFELVKSIEEVHITPWQAEQKFIYCYFRKNG
ncbi:MAG: class I SAM-dependent methyltransferase [Candidatus Omnitrophica bacterium]|nr:class I SAM-dependent methyltransferase [Candidatus Omnitrophota bacterium]